MASVLACRPSNPPFVCRQQAGIAQMSVTELADILQDPAKRSQVQLLDVREPAEHDVVHLPEFQLMPFTR